MKLHPHEKKIAVFRKHPFYIAVDAALFLFLAILPIALYRYGLPFLGIELSIVLTAILDTLFWLWILFLWVGFFVAWTNYSLDLWILTNERLVDVEQLGLFSRSVATLELSQVEDVTIETHGIWDELLRSGTVKVQTAGTKDEFRIRNVALPESVKDTILIAHRAKRDEVKKVEVVNA